MSSPIIVAVGGGEAEALSWLKAFTPVLTAFIAAFLALLVNRALDRRKAQRDHAGDLVETLRDDVRAAVELAADYWSAKPSNKSVLEARMKMLEREIRAGLSLICEGQNGLEAAACRAASTEFLIVLTGTDFESAKVSPNAAHLRDVAGRGVALRKAAAIYRNVQLGQKTSKPVSA